VLPFAASFQPSIVLASRAGGVGEDNVVPGGCGGCDGFFWCAGRNGVGVAPPFKLFKFGLRDDARPKWTNLSLL